MYKAIIARISVSEVEGAKTLNQGKILGYSVAVDKSVEDGSLQVFFTSDGELSKEYATANDLVFRGTDPTTGKRLGGYFGPKRRVTSQKFMQGKLVSEGFCMPLASLEFTGADIGALKEGAEFDTLNGIPICRKYITEATKKAMASGSKTAKAYAEVDFPQHTETAQYKRVSESIPLNSVVFITEKLHGTSGRMGNVKVQVARSW